MNIKQIAILAGIPLLIIVVVIFGSDKSFNSAPKQVTEIAPSIINKNQVQPPQTKVDITKDYKAVLHTTYGDITIQINTLDATITATNFIYLARSGFYDNTIFHRVVKDFMIQGGDPTGTGSGGPGYHFNDEPFDGEYTKGTVAMANAGPNTNGSQFFIMQKDRTDLPKNYVIFGTVINGMETVDKIAESEVIDSGNGEMSKPVSPVSVTSIDIIEK
ncbi:MAG: peptidylprolyl isomerase [Patescibacteria group bacterium]